MNRRKKNRRSILFPIIGIVITSCTLLATICLIAIKVFADTSEPVGQNIHNSTIVTAIIETTKAKITTTTATTTIAETTIECTTITEVTTTTETTETEFETEMDISDLYITPDMDLSKISGVSKEQFCLWMENLSCDYSGFFSRNAEEIWQLCREYEVNEIFFVGLIGAESGWVTHEVHVSKCNYTSIMSSNGLNSYSSEYEGLYASAHLLGIEYFTENGQYYPGSTTLYDMASIYCPDNPDTEENESWQWQELVYSCMSLVLSDMQEME